MARFRGGKSSFIETGFGRYSGVIDVSVSGGISVTGLLNSNYMVEYTMKKNVASQSIGAQMITISDGSDFTGTVSAEVTIDSGTKTAGGGTVTHEGEGYHSYAPTQAETNGDHIAVSFTGTGALSQTIQVYTTFPQAVDNDVKISLIPTTAMRGTDSAATAANLAIVDSNVDSILVDTGTTLPAGQTVINDNVLLIPTTPMRGTDGANTTTPPTTAQIWAETTRVLTAGTNIALAKGVGLTGLNDIAASSIVTGGAITTSAGNANINLVKINGVTINGDGAGTPFDV